MRAVMVEDAQVAPDALLDLLHAHLPYSLPVLRNYQFCRSLRGGPTPSSRALFARHQQPGGAGGQQQQETPPENFAAAYVDLARYPETQGYIYSTLDDVASPAFSASSSAGDGNAHNAAGHAAAQAAADELVLALLRRIRRIDEQHGQDSVSSSSSPSSSRPRGKIMLGSLSEALRARLLALKLGILKSPNATAQDGWDLYGKWLFPPGALAPPEGAEGAEEAEKAMMALPRGMRWDRAGKEDMGVIREAGSIRRTEETLLRLPSALVRLDDGTPVAWGFLSFDGSLISLHVEEPYRGQGVAKAVARKLMRDHLRDYGDDGWGAADVFVENEQSQGVCKSLGGKLGWLSSWLVIDLKTVGEPI